MQVIINYLFQSVVAKKVMVSWITLSTNRKCSIKATKSGRVSLTLPGHTKWPDFKSGSPGKVFSIFSTIICQQLWLSWCLGYVVCQIRILSRMIGRINVFQISFLISPEIIPGRMTLLVTLFLVLINIYNNVSRLAACSNGITLLGIWMLTCILFIFGALGN